MRARAGEGGILVGDVGGTHTRLSLYDARGARRLAEVERPSQAHASLEEIAVGFLADWPGSHPAVAVLGVAGPVVDGGAQFTNLPWRIDDRSLARRLSIPRVVLVNDLVAAARGCLVTPPDGIIALTGSPPAPLRATAALIAAGTGLGEGRLIWTGERHVALATEGGHGDFAPQTPLEIELWHFLTARFPDHVSYERVLSGQGLANLFDFFASRAGRMPRAVAKRLAEGDRHEAIVELGLARAYRPAAKAVDQFAALYGAEAGNLALREVALGGVFVTGSIGRAIVPARRDLFLERFRKKGRFHGMLAKIPVGVVAGADVGVRGSLAIAKELLREGALAKPRRAQKA